MKRFYEAVANTQMDGGFTIMLDGKPVRTPGRNLLLLPTYALAEAVEAEWAAQRDVILPASMPLMRLAATAIDQVAPHATAVAAETAKYAMTDLLCYRATEPQSLVERQAAVWQPLLDWTSLRFDAPLRVSAGIVPAEQSESSLRALAAALPVSEPFTLTALADLTALCGSIVLALAVWERRIDAKDAADAALLDELFQAGRWGEDAEAAARRRHVRSEIEAVSRFLHSLE